MTEESIPYPDEPQWTAFIAIDWADRKHVWKLQPAASEPCEQGELEQTPEAIEVWAGQLATRFQGRPIAVALEQSRGAVVFALTKFSSGASVNAAESVWCPASPRRGSLFWIPKALTIGTGESQKRPQGKTERLGEPSRAPLAVALLPVASGLADAEPIASDGSSVRRDTTQHADRYAYGDSP